MSIFKKILFCLIAFMIVVFIISAAVFLGAGEGILKALSLISGVYLFVFCKNLNKIF